MSTKKKPAKPAANKKPAAKAKAKPSSKKQPVTTETIQAPYHFQPKEIEGMNVELRNKLDALDLLAEQKKAAMQDFKLRETNLENEVKMLRNKLGSGEETRSLTANVEFDSANGKKTYVHPTTGAVIRTEPMTAADWQLPMFKRDEKGQEQVAPPGAIDDKKPAPPAAAKPSRAEKKKPSNENAGQTNVGAALDTAGALKDAAPLTIDLTLDWQKPGLIKEVKKEAKAAKWSQVQISLFVDVLDKCEDVKAMIETIRPHTKPAEPAN